MLCLLVATTLFPLLYDIYLSLTTTNIYLPIKPNLTDNYLTLILNPIFGYLNALEVTAIFSGVAVVLEVVLGIAIAILLNQEFNGRNLLRAIIILPLLISPVSIGLNWRLMFEPQTYGLFNFILSSLGQPIVPWLANPNLSQAAENTVDEWEWPPVMVLIFLSTLQLVPKAPYEAAIIDGASRWKVFTRITLPAMRQMIVIAVLIRLMDSLNTFPTIYVMTYGGPGTATSILNFNMFLQAFDYGYIGVAAAEALVLVVIIIVIARTFMKLV